MSAPDTKPATRTPEAGEEGRFLARWSRRKHAAEAGQPLPEPPLSAPPARKAGTAPTDLPDPATLSFDDDFSAYLGAGVSAALKRAALAKLFTDPSFNRMDGLDVYIEDYNLAPMLSAGERDLLAHARGGLQPASPAPPSAQAAPEPGAMTGTAEASTRTTTEPDTASPPPQQT